MGFFAGQGYYFVRFDLIWFPFFDNHFAELQKTNVNPKFLTVLQRVIGQFTGHTTGIIFISISSHILVLLPIRLIS